MPLEIAQAPLELVDLFKWIGGIAVSTFGVLLTRSINRVESDIKEKADADHTRREISRIESQLQEAREARERELRRLEAQLQESREARERDIERLERASAEKFAEFSESVRDRLNSLERNLDQRLVLILQAVNKK